MGVENVVNITPLHGVSLGSMTSLFASLATCSAHIKIVKKALALFTSCIVRGH